MNIEGTRTTPSIRIQPGRIEIKGRSIPEDSNDFYHPILLAVQDYLSSNQIVTVFHFYLEYINSGSKKSITTILAKCNDHYLEGRDIKVEWFYDADDESIEELGLYLQGLLQLPFRLIKQN